MAINTIPTFFTVVFILSRIQISESPGYCQNEDTDDVDRTDDQTDDNPSSCRLVTCLRLKIQILLH